MSAIPIGSLTPAERLSLIGELWDSLDSLDVPVTPEQRDELDRRLGLAEGDPGKLWSELEPILRRRLRR